jgi:cyanate permease
MRYLRLVFAIIDNYDRKRKETGDDRYYSPLERKTQSLSRALYLSIFTPFRSYPQTLLNRTRAELLEELMAYDRMALFLNLWNGLISGVLYLAFQVFPVFFVEVHGFSVQDAGLTFIGMGFGMVLTIIYIPLTKRCVLLFDDYIKF